jgi:hypothetical protein
LSPSDTTLEAHKYPDYRLLPTFSRRIRNAPPTLVLYKRPSSSSFHRAQLSRAIGCHTQTLLRHILPSTNSDDLVLDPIPSLELIGNLTCRFPPTHIRIRLTDDHHVSDLVTKSQENATISFSVKWLCKKECKRESALRMSCEDHRVRVNKSRSKATNSSSFALHLHITVSLVVWTHRAACHATR